MSESYHMSFNVRGLLENSRRKSLKGYFTKDDGTPCSDTEARSYLYECISKGWRLIPVGDCDNFCHQKGCKGHQVDDE
jgi:hypothetical protein